jgi:DNA primase
MIDAKDLVERISAADYISQYVEFEEKNGELFSICPFHNDTDPSFSVTPSNNLFYCFGCKKSGNILDFIMLYHDVNFREAINIACKFVGGDVKTLPEPLEAVKVIKAFTPKTKGYKSVKYKKLADDIMSRYEFNLDKLSSWLNEGVSEEVLRKHQVKYDAFSNRIVFPIWNENGDIINIKGRTLDENYREKKIAKYQNFYDIGVMDYVYNLNFAKDDIKRLGFVVVFEAEKSVMLAETYGISNTIAIMTSQLNEHQLKILITLGVDVVFALDKDQDVNTDKNIQKLKKYAKVSYLKDESNLLGDKDAPIDKGRDVFIELYKNRKKMR